MMPESRDNDDDYDDDVDYNDDDNDYVGPVLMLMWRSLHIVFLTRSVLCL